MSKLLKAYNFDKHQLRRLSIPTYFPKLLQELYFGAPTDIYNTHLKWSYLRSPTCPTISVLK